MTDLTPHARLQAAARDMGAQDIEEALARTRAKVAEIPVTAAREGGHQTLEPRVMPGPEAANRNAGWCLRRAAIWGGLALGMALYSAVDFVADPGRTATPLTTQEISR